MWLNCVTFARRAGADEELKTATTAEMREKTVG
jgi:hypothetical protein